MKNNQKGFVVPALIAIIALLVIGGGVFYTTQKNNVTPNEPTPSQDVVISNDNVEPGTVVPRTPTSTVTPIVKPSPAVSLKIYRNEKYGIEFTLPTEYSLGNKSELSGDYIETYRSKINSNKYFSVHIITIARIRENALTLTGKNYNNRTVAIENIIEEQRSYNAYLSSEVNGRKQTTVAGNVAIQQEERTVNDNGTDVYLITYTLRDGNLIKLVGADDLNREEYNQILSTFKFIPSTRPDVIVLSPNGGENWKIGQTYSISVASKGDLGTKTVRLNRYSDDGVRVGEQTIGTMQANTFSFKVPVRTDETRGDAARYKIQVVSDKYNSGLGVSDESDNYFSITNQQVQVYINVVDKEGNPFKPDRVEWYYPPVNGQATQYLATCTTEACTRWSVTGATASKIYVVANYKKPSPPGAACFSQAYDAEPVELSSESIEVTLTMGLESYCY